MLTIYLYISIRNSVQSTNISQFSHLGFAPIQDNKPACTFIYVEILNFMEFKLEYLKHNIADSQFSLLLLLLLYFRIRIRLYRIAMNLIRTF